MAKAKMRVFANPPTNLYIRGPDPKLSTGPTPVKALLDAGVEVGVGTDNTRDYFAPLGNADMLFAALLLGHQRRFGGRATVNSLLKLVTEKGAELMGLKPGYGVKEGCQADLVVLDASTSEEALIDLAPRKYVIKRGKIVVQDGKLVPLNSLA